MYYNNDEDNNGNKGNRGKFSDRLKKMRRDRLKIKKYGRLEENKINLKDICRNIFKIVLSVPSIVYNNLFDKDRDINKVDSINEKKEVTSLSSLSKEA